MTKFKIMIISLFIIFSVSSCKNNAYPDLNSPASIELNNGTRWLVNAEMKPFITESESILNTYIANGSADFKTMAKELADKNSGLIKSCTMDGKSHEELHKWLHPHMALIESLQDAENADVANKIIAELKSSFEIYNQHFQ